MLLVAATRCCSFFVNVLKPKWPGQQVLLNYWAHTGWSMIKTQSINSDWIVDDWWSNKFDVGKQTYQPYYDRWQSIGKRRISLLVSWLRSFTSCQNEIHARELSYHTFMIRICIVSPNDACYRYNMILTFVIYLHLSRWFDVSYCDGL